jgi:hypothetical protein
MKLIIIGLLLGLIFIGCGYKADPIYVDDNKIEQKGEK